MFYFRCTLYICTYILLLLLWGRLSQCQRSWTKYDTDSQKKNTNRLKEKKKLSQMTRMNRYTVAYTMCYLKELQN